MTTPSLPAPRIPAPQVIAADAVPALRWGSVGAGGIAGRFTDAIHAHSTQRMVTVAARDRDRTAAFAAAHGIGRVHASAEALVTDPEIDVVYVSTPHTAHREVALAAIAAGKSVLIEKPIAMSAAEAHEIADAARSAGVLVMEAMWTRYLPQSDIIRQLLADGAVGEVDLVTADFGFAMPFDATNRLYDPALGGGALLDAGVYPISFASSIIGAPSRIAAFGALAPTGVDARAAVSLTTESGASAQLATSIVSALPVRATIVGTLGRIEVHAPFFAPTGLTLVTGGFGAETTSTWTDTRFTDSSGGVSSGLSDQATALAHYRGEGRTESPVHGLDEVVSVLATIDEARRQIADANA